MFLPLISHYNFSASTDKVQVSTPTTAAAIITPSMTTVSSTSLEEMSVPMPTTSEAQGHMTSQGDHVTSERTSEANHVTSEANQAHSSTVSSDNLVPNNYSGKCRIYWYSAQPFTISTRLYCVQVAIIFSCSVSWLRFHWFLSFLSLSLSWQCFFIAIGRLHRILKMTKGN